MIPVIVWGAGGRMGGRLIRLITESTDLNLMDAIDVPDHSGFGLDIGRYHNLKNLGTTLKSRPGRQAERGVVLDLSLPGGTAVAIHWAEEHQWAFVSGTTGLAADEIDEINSASKNVPVLHAPNFSIGIQLLFDLVARAARALPDTFHVSITESHHQAKADRPSGTAREFESVITRNNREPRLMDSAALRLSNIIGEHSIRFRSESEEIVFSHIALDRDVFAVGALQAVRWIHTQPPGSYTMADVLELQ